MKRYTQRSLKPYLLGSASAFLMASGAHVSYAEEATEAGIDELALAEQTQAQSAQQNADNQSDGEIAVEQIVVTGSRIRSDVFTSPTPIQTLDAEQSLKLGISNIGEMLDRSPITSGQQLNRTVNTNAGNSNATEAPTEGGSGSTNIDLRGLGIERTLVLVNGKRLGKAGARGAPAQPDIGLIPLGMIEGVDLLTGGQSTIYGADAVAGVVNIRMKEDFEGIDISGSTEFPEAGGGEQFRTSIVTGVSSERGNITLGFEYFKQKRVSGADRDFTPCLRDIEISEDGETFAPCRSGFFDDIVLLSTFGSPGIPGFEEGDMPPGVPVGPNGVTFSDSIFFLFTPGETDIGIPNFSSGFALPPVPDPVVGAFPGEDPDSISAFPFFSDFNDQYERQQADLVRPIERFSFASTGHLDLDLGNEEELYYEAYYFDRQTKAIAAREQIFPDVKAMIPQEDENGNIVVDDTGAPVLVDNPLNPFPVPVAPIITLSDLDQNFETDVQQFRGVIGFRGDVGTDWFKERNWTYDAFFSYDRGTGSQTQTILFEPNLTLATQTLRVNSDGELECGIPLDNGLSGIGGTNQNGFLTPQECVPEAGAFFPNAFRGPNPGDEGTFASDAARDFLLGERTNRTVVQQWNSSVNVTGDLFDIPGGDTVGIALGAEWRSDQINSQNSIVGVRGLNAAENPIPEGQTAGKRWIYDVYGETRMPLVVDRPFIEYLELNGAVRFTEEQNFGSEVTWRVGGLWRPMDWVTFSFSRNTSFRAPSLREAFLANQGQGISGGSDPCNVASFTQLDPTDPDTQLLEQNCLLSGADPTVVGSAGTTTIPVQVGGSTDVGAEESDSLTLTAQFSQPWFDSFELDLAVTYYDIDVTNNVAELDAGVIISRCFNDDPNLTSPFCRLISREGSNQTLDQIAAQGGATPGNNQIDFVDASFINLGIETADGIDITSRFRTDIGTLDNSPIDLTWTTGVNHIIEQKRQIFSDSPVIENAGRIGNAEWTFNTTLSVQWSRFQVLYQGRFIGETEFDEDLQDPEEPFRDNPDLAGNFLSRDDGIADRRFYSDISLSVDLTGIVPVVFTAGINNVNDEDPPLIDDSEGPNRLNAVTASGFDLLGRTFFANATMRF